jgi:Flp pilus assembly protein TadD
MDLRMTPNSTNPHARSRIPLTAGFLILVVALALTVAGCSGSSDTGAGVTTTTAAATTSATAAGATTSTDPGIASVGGANRVIVGGKSQQDYEASIPQLQKAVEANPTDLSALQELAVAQYNADKLEDAAATYQKMLAIKDDPTVHNNYGNVLRDLKKVDEAMAEYRKALAGNPALFTAYINLAAMYVAQKNVAEAEKLLDQGIAHTTGADQESLKRYKSSLSQAK